MRELQYTKVLKNDSSFQLVRTNPKLTGNVKLAVNEKGDMYLNAIKANLELSNDDYSKFPVDPNRSHAANLFYFFKGGSTPNEIIFDLNEQVDLFKTSKNFKDQYDFSHYFSGAKYLASNKYEERMSYFAPLYLKKEVPNYFVVFKIEDPLNDVVSAVKSAYDSGDDKGQYMLDFFKKATIIKTFDLRPETTVGKYIRTYIEDINFPISPLTVSFEEDDFTSWNGVIVNDGVLGSKGEYLYEFYQNSYPLKFFEQNMTDGFSRNGIIFPNILNLEFIFNDDSSEKYDFNRYFGMYVNSLEVTSLELDIKRVYLERSTWENTPVPKREYLETDEVVIIQENTDGVQLPYKNSIANLSEFNEGFTSSSLIYFNYLQDKDGGLHLLKTTPDYIVDYSEERLANLSYSVPTSKVTATLDSHGYSTGDIAVIDSIQDSSYSGEFMITVIDEDTFTYSVLGGVTSSPVSGTSKIELKSGKLRLSDKNVDMGLFFGQSRNLFLQDDGFSTTIGGHSHLAIKLTSNPSNLDEIKLYHPKGSRQDANGKYELIVATSNYSLVPDSGDFYVYNDFDITAGNDVFYFNSTGYLTEVATALAGCINGMRNSQFTAYVYKEYVFIKLNIPGDFDSLHKLTFNSPSNNYSPLTINEIVDIENKVFNFEGGSPETGNRLIIDAGHLQKIQDNLDSILVKTSNSWSKIRKVSKYIDLITEKNLATPSSVDNSLGDYLSKIAIVLEENETPTIRYTQFTMRPKFKPSFGLISMFPIKDLDFDFYASDYSNFPEIDLYNYYFIPEGQKIMTQDYKYEVIGAGVIEVEGTQYSAGTPIILASPTASYSIVSGNPLVTYYMDYTAMGEKRTTPINDENNELKDFQGFSILKDPNAVVPQSATIEYQLKTKFLNGLTQTEYDFYKENDSLDFAVRSKILPYITKWGILEGKDSRDNQYRLNTEIVFGRNNFSPDQEDKTQNPLNFTHEWFYIESIFNYVNDPETIKLNYNYFETPLDEAKLLSDPNYFIDYFTYTPSDGSTEVGPTQIRYSNVIRNRAGEYETFFKGFKLNFKDYLDPNFLGEDGKPQSKSSTRFDGYRFSTILKVVQEDIHDKSQAPVKYRVIEHKDYKFIVVIIELAIGSIDQIDDYWKEVQSFEPISEIDTTNFLDPTYSPILSGLLPFETVDGDYRIQFSGNSMSNLTHTFLYSTKSKKFNNILNSFSTVKFNKNLSFQINGPSGVDSTAGTVKSFANPSIANYSSGLNDDATSFNDVNFITIKDTNSGFDFFMTSVNGFVPVIQNPVTGAFTEFLTYDNTQGLSLITTSTSAPYYSFYSVLPAGSNLIVERFYAFKVLTGGENYFEKIFQKLSFANFKKYVNTLDPMIEYYSYSLTNNVSTLASDPGFYFEVIDQNSITKMNQLIYQPTTEIPTQFSGQSVIGYDYEQARLNVKYELNRYRGEYEPVFTNVLSCNSGFTFNRNEIENVTLANIVINPKIDNNLTIKNFNHIKVADSRILDLESDSTYLAKYATISEVAINQAEYFLLRGNWDWGFHYRYSNKSEFTPVSGALRVEEDDSFIAKLISLPETIELEDFEVTTLDKTQELKNVDLDQIELVVKEGQVTVEGYINVNNVLTRHLIEDGISQKFSEFLINSTSYIGNYLTIQQYVEDYIKQNVLKLYDVSTNEFFSKNVKDLISAVGATNINTIAFYFLNDQERFKQGYALNRALQINNTSRLILKFSFNKKPGSSLAISPKITVKFI